jgi:hypothetical protein
MADRELLPDRTDAASDLSGIAESPLLSPDVELRGLSVLLGILDLNAPRRDRVDSLVSALLKDGYCWKLSLPLSREVCDALLLGVLAPPVPLELWFPIVT